MGKPIHRLFNDSTDDADTLITEQRIEAYVNKKWVLVNERTVNGLSWEVCFEYGKCKEGNTDHSTPKRCNAAACEWVVNKKETADILLADSDNLLRVLNCNDDPLKTNKCGKCDGHGVLTCNCPSEKQCSACEGNAYTLNVLDCEQCKGSGRFRTNEWNCQGSKKAFRVKPAVQPMAEMSHAEVISWAIRELEDRNAEQHLSAKIRILKKQAWDGNTMVSTSRTELATCGFEEPEAIQVIMAKTMNVNHALILATELAVPDDSVNTPLNGFKWLMDMDMKACKTCGKDGKVNGMLGWGAETECTVCVGRDPKREGAEFGQFWADCKAVRPEACNQERKCSLSPYSRLLTNPDLEKDYKNSKPPCSNPNCENGWINVKWWPDQDCPDCELSTKCKDCKGADCDSCGGSGRVDIPKWKLRTRKFLNNGLIVAALQDVAQSAVSNVENNEIVADLRIQYKEMKRRKSKYNRFVLEGRTEEANALSYEMGKSVIKNLGVAAISAVACPEGIRLNTIRDFVDSVGDGHWEKAVGGLGDMAFDVIAFNVGGREEWEALGRNIFAGGRCSRDPSECPKCSGEGSIKPKLEDGSVNRMVSWGDKCTDCDGKGTLSDFRACSHNRHETKEQCQAAQTYEKAPCEWINCGKAHKTEYGKCNVCDAKWDASWNGLARSSGDLLFAAACYQAGADKEQIKACMLALEELANDPSMENMKKVGEKGAKAAVGMAVSHQTNKWMGFMGDKFAKEIQELVGEYPAQKIQQYVMAKCREKMTGQFTKLPERYRAGPKRRRRMMALSSRKQARSSLLTEDSLSPQFAALVLAIEGEGFRFRCD